MGDIPDYNRLHIGCIDYYLITLDRNKIETILIHNKSHW